MIGFIIYKVYHEVFEGKDSTPWYRAYLYISLLFVLISFIIYLLVSGLIETFIKLKTTNLSFDLFNSYFFLIIIFGLIPLAFVYFYFFYKKSIEYYDAKYSKHWLNKFYFRGSFFLLYFFLFLLGPTLRVLLFGGYMFGRDYEGYVMILFK